MVIILSMMWLSLFSLQLPFIVSEKLRKSVEGIEVKYAHTNKIYFFDPIRMSRWVGCRNMKVGERPSFYHLKLSSCISMITAALLTIGKRQKQSKCPRTGEWIHKMWYRHTLKHYLALKN